MSPLPCIIREFFTFSYSSTSIYTYPPCETITIFSTKILQSSYQLPHSSESSESDSRPDSRSVLPNVALQRSSTRYRRSSKQVRNEYVFKYTFIRSRCLGERPLRIIGVRISRHVSKPGGGGGGGIKKNTRSQAIILESGKTRFLHLRSESARGERRKIENLPLVGNS